MLRVWFASCDAGIRVVPIDSGNAAGADMVLQNAIDRIGGVNSNCDTGIVNSVNVADVARSILADESKRPRLTLLSHP
ncbi:hypothetical protein [Novipirellula maiorica]|nr:hypothetical protein [Rhodopirellula maiorica]